MKNNNDVRVFSLVLTVLQFPKHPPDSFFPSHD